MPTVQGTIEDAIYKMTSIRSTLIGSGRTDAGVHAICQVANFKTDNHSIPLKGFVNGLNSLLPDDISILDAEEVFPDFNARIHALQKEYIYLILMQNIRAPILNERAWLIRHRLNLKDMKEACAYLIGTHDFKPFQKAGSSVKTSVRTVYKCGIEQKRCLLSGLNLIELSIVANGFLRGMVRNIAGLMVAVGMNKVAPEVVRGILSGEGQVNQLIQWRSAPPYGLYLKKVYY